MSAIEELRANLHQLTAKLQADLKPALEAAAQKFKTAAEDASVAYTKASTTFSLQLKGWCEHLEKTVPNTVDILHDLAKKYPALQEPVTRLEEKVPNLNVVAPVAAAVLLLLALVLMFKKFGGNKQEPVKKEKTPTRPDVKKQREEEARERNLHHASREVAGTTVGGQHLQIDAAALDVLAERLYRVLKVEPFIVKSSKEAEEKAQPAREAEAPRKAASPSVKQKERKEKKPGRHLDNMAGEANTAGNHEKAVDGSDGEMKNSVHASEADGEQAVSEDGHGKDSHEE